MFPAFTYDARTHNLVDETAVTRQAFSGLLVGVAWGVAVAIFVEPLGIGVVRPTFSFPFPFFPLDSFSNEKFPFFC